MNKKIVYIAVGIILLVAFIALAYLFYSSKNKDNAKISQYPLSVQEAIKSPIEKNEGWRTLVDDNDFQISYSSNDGIDSFFITINASPVLDVSIKAEQALLKKLQVNQDSVCALPIVINIPFSIDANLSQYDFGLSFCPNKTHIFEILEQEQLQKKDEVSNPDSVDLR